MLTPALSCRRSRRFAWGSDLAQEAVEVRQGYSKQHRPDLKQIVVSLIPPVTAVTSQQSALPLWLEVLNGNSSDKKTLPTTVSKYCNQLQSNEQPCFIMDSAGYSQASLVDYQAVHWLSRVPETMSAAKQALRSVPTDQMHDLGDG
jgi:transposase